MNLNYTYFEDNCEPTYLDKLFWGRVKMENTYSLLYFEKNKSTQHLLHALKYSQKKEVGILLGKMIANKIGGAINSEIIDGIVPVPLHPKKEFIRGYNQSEQLAKGLGEILHIPVLSNLILKPQNNISQTKRSKFLRWMNVEHQFTVNRKKLKGKSHLLIVDDVITTGSTIEAISKTILKESDNIKLSVISLAITK